MNLLIPVLVIAGFIGLVFSNFLPDPSLEDIRKLRATTPGLWWQILLALFPLISGFAAFLVGISELPKLAGFGYLISGAVLLGWGAKIVLEGCKRLIVRRKRSSTNPPNPNGPSHAA